MTLNENPQIVDRAAWLDARRELLDVEKEFTRQRDQLAELRRRQPWVKVDEQYVFESTEGPISLDELFEGRPQLVVYHFMLGPDWEEGCPSCSFWADNYNGITSHLAARDTTLVGVSRAPLEAIEAYRNRMGWSFGWVSSLENDFNMDLGVSFPEGYRDERTYNYAAIPEPPEELPGLSVFYRDDSGSIFHTYSCYARGLDVFNTAYQILDVTPMGRHEDGLEWPMAWLRRHDEYVD